VIKHYFMEGKAFVFNRWTGGSSRTVSDYFASGNLSQDIAVRREGVFVLRYRVFDIYSATGGQESPIFSELYGGPFKVYSTRDFPGLDPSTDLTKVNFVCSQNLTTFPSLSILEFVEIWRTCHSQRCGAQV
jgi:hypothetical protein